MLKIFFPLLNALEQQLDWCTTMRPQLLFLTSHWNLDFPQTLKDLFVRKVDFGVSFPTRQILKRRNGGWPALQSPMTLAWYKSYKSYKSCVSFSQRNLMLRATAFLSCRFYFMTVSLTAVVWLNWYFSGDDRNSKRYVIIYIFFFFK